MLSEPQIITRAPTRLFEIVREVWIPFPDVAREAIPGLFGILAAANIAPLGPLFFHYTRIRMPDLTVGFAVPVADDAACPEGLSEALLPEGRYATLTHTGPYDGLVPATGHLLQWIAATGDATDHETRADGDHFAGRFEVYPNGPDDEPDPMRWETILFIKLR